MPVKVWRNPKTSKAHFDKVPNYLLRGMGELSDFAFRLYMYLHSQSKDYHPTQKTLAKHFNKSESAIERAFTELKKYGYLKQVNNQESRKKTYFVLEEPVQPEP